MDIPALLAWYRAHHRTLPWRSEVSPWRTLVSELMLQQTRVETVIPYFERFISRFPTPEALACEPEELVLEYWSGLGYYSRARNLHRCALAIVGQGGFPRNSEGLRALPGVGPYTAGAVGAIALGLDLPVVDGNVERVFSRFYAEEAPGKAWYWQTATRLLPPGQAGDYDQALMELGATVCTPKVARCLLCPVATGCSGKGSPLSYPAAKAKKPIPREQAWAFVVRRGDAILLARRPLRGLLAGMWELPGAKAGATGAWLAGRELGVVAHTFTHLHRETTVVEAGQIGSTADLGYVDERFVTPEIAQGMALSTLARKTLALVQP